jgi:hypothetical protein
MVNVHTNIVSPAIIKELLTYLDTVDTVSDIRPNITTKSPAWDNSDWPKHCIASVLDKVLEHRYSVKEILFFSHEIYLSIHNHSGLGTALEPLYKAVLIPLEVPKSGPVGTVFFNNYWAGPQAKFGSMSYYKYGFDLVNKFGDSEFVNDVRELKSLLLDNPTQVKNFEASTDFIQHIDYLISWVPANRNKIINDYTQIENYSGVKFPEDIRLKYCNHYKQEDLHGLVLDRYVQWQIGDAIEFDRTQLHCTASQTLGKKAIVVFTNVDTG